MCGPIKVTEQPCTLAPVGHHPPACTSVRHHPHRGRNPAPKPGLVCPPPPSIQNKKCFQGASGGLAFLTEATVSQPGFTPP